MANVEASGVKTKADITSPPPEPPKSAPKEVSFAKLLQALAVPANSLGKIQQADIQLSLLADLQRLAKELADLKEVRDNASFQRMANALIALAHELAADPKSLTSSSIRTVQQSVACLSALAKAKTNRPLDAVKILIVDDDAVAREMIKRSVKLLHLAQDTVTSPMEALERVAANRYDLFALDVNMPVMTGYELCEKLRQRPEHKKTPVVFVTAWNTMDSRLQFENSSGNDFVSKPFLAQELAAKMLLHLLEE